MIIELGRNKDIRELLIENRTTGTQGHICYWNGGQMVSGTRAAVCMEVKGTGMHKGTYNWPPSWEMRTGTHRTTVEEAKKY